MSGPIVRTGTTPKFWENWDHIFGESGGRKKKKPAAGKKKPAKASAKKKSAKKKVKK